MKMIVEPGLFFQDALFKVLAPDQANVSHLEDDTIWDTLRWYAEN
jgi:hypothetical protein